MRHITRKLEPGEKLGKRELLAIGVGGMIGGGIFSVLGITVALSGNGAPFAFLVGAVVALVAGYFFVRLALHFRDDGGVFTYLRGAWPRVPALPALAGWILLAMYVGTLALYAYTFAAYGADLLGEPGLRPLRIFLALGVLAFFVLVNLEGVRASGTTEDLMVYTKLIILGLFALIGLFRADYERFLPAFDQGVTAVFLGAAVIFVAFEGFELVANAVKETQDPERDLPFGIYGSILVTAAVYVLLAVVAVGSLSLAEIRAASDYALAKVAEPVLGQAGRYLIALSALLATSSAINSTLFGASRMVAEMAQEGSLPRVFAARDARGVPWLGVVALAVAAGAFAVLGSLSLIAEFSSLTFLLVVLLVALAGWKLRREIHVNPWLAAAGFVLVLVVAATLLGYLATHRPDELVALLAIYAGVGLGALYFGRRVRAAG
ncbi:APC family permease [Deinococcota bacterium DY0809b]